MAEIDSNIALNSGRQGPGAVNFAELLRLKKQLDLSQLQQQLTQQEMQKNQMGMADEQQLRDLVAQGGNPAEVQARLMGAGRLKESLAYQDQQTKQQTAKLAQQEQAGKLIKAGATRVLAQPTEQNAIAVINELEAATGQKMDNDRATVYALRGDPQGLAKWAAGHALEADKLLPQIKESDMGGTRDTTMRDPVTGQLISTQSQPKTMTPGEVASNQVAQGNLAVNQGQLNVAQQKLALEGQKNQRESTAQQKLDIAQELTAKKDALRIDNTMAKVDTVLTKVDEAVKQTGSMTSGLTGKLISQVPGTPAYDLDKTIDTIKANIGFNELNEMRQASPTGGALGQVAVRELEFLQAALAQLDIGQSEKQQLKHLNQVKEHYTKWKDTLTAAKNGLPAPAATKKVGSLPDPAKYKGYEADSDDGVTYISNGTKWIKK